MAVPQPKQRCCLSTGMPNAILLPHFPSAGSHGLHPGRCTSAVAVAVGVELGSRLSREPAGEVARVGGSGCWLGPHVLVRVLAGVAHGLIVLGCRTAPKVLPRRRLLVLCLVLLLRS